MDSVISRLEKFATEGMFGEIHLLRVGPSSNDEKSAQFQSQLGFFEVDLVTRKGKVRKVPVVVKLQLDSQEQHSHDQFANEVAFYAKIMPGLGAEKLCPIMYHGHATAGKDPKEDIIILEDLRPGGYKVPKEVYLDHDHISLAMKRLGEFHGLSYKMKSASLDKFNELKDLLTEKWLWDCEPYVAEAIRRGFSKDLQSAPGYSILNKAYKKLASTTAVKLMTKLQQPEEPFAVIVHGDFLKNNVLFRYDENGSPCDMKMFDFATAFYSDPAVDLSLFLYMHTREEGRADHWQSYLKTYWDAVLSVGHPGFTFKEFLSNFSKRAVYGYVICSFFFPYMLTNVKSIDGTPADPKFNDYPDDQKRELARTAGGDDSTAALRSMIRHLQDEGYLEEYLLNFKQ